MISEVDIHDWDKDIRVMHIRENHDGSADATVRLSGRGLAVLVRFGFARILKESISNDTSRKE